VLISTLMLEKANKSSGNYGPHSVMYDYGTRGSAVAEGPRDALNQLKSCQ